MVKMRGGTHKLDLAKTLTREGLQQELVGKFFRDGQAENGLIIEEGLAC